MALHQIIYTSHSIAAFSPAALIDLLSQSRRDNAANGITGLLLHADGSFMQTIEGEFVPLQRLFARIEHDPRHTGVILMCDEPIAARSFDDWSMAFREIDSDTAARVPGFQAAITRSDTKPDRDLAHRVMRAFAASSGLLN